MSKIMVSLEVEEATYKLGEGLGSFAADMALALKDGFQVVDIGPIIAATMADLIPVLGNFQALPADMKENMGDFAAAWMKAGIDLYKKLQAPK